MTNVEKMINALKASAPATLSDTDTTADLETGEVIIGDALLNDTIQINNPDTPSSTDYIWGISEPADGSKPTVKKFTPTQLVDAVNQDVNTTKTEIEEMKTSIESTKQEIDGIAEDVTEAGTTAVLNVNTAKTNALSAIGESDTAGARGNAITAIQNAQSAGVTAVQNAQTAGVSAVQQAQTNALSAIGQDDSTGARGSAIDAIEQAKEDAEGTLEEKAAQLSVAPWLPYPSFNVKYDTETQKALIRLSNDYSGIGDVDMRYTSDGSVPTSDSAVFPSSGLEIGWNCTIKVRAFPSANMENLAPSVTNSAYIEDLEADAPPAPVLEIQVGTAIDNCLISITNYNEISVADAVIRYTTDGTEPTSSSTEAGADTISVTGNGTVKFKGFYNGGSISDPASVTISNLKAQAPVINLPDGPSQGDIEESSDTPVNLASEISFDGAVPDKGFALGNSSNYIVYIDTTNQVMTFPIEDTTSNIPNGAYYTNVSGSTSFGISGYNLVSPLVNHDIYIRLSIISDINPEYWCTINTSSEQQIIGLSSNGNNHWSTICKMNIDTTETNAMLGFYNVMSLNSTSLTNGTTVSASELVIVDVTANQDFFTSKGLTTDDAIKTYLDGIDYEDFPSLESNSTPVDNMAAELEYKGTSFPASSTEGLSGSEQNMITQFEAQPTKTTFSSDTSFGEGSGSFSQYYPGGATIPIGEYFTYFGLATMMFSPDKIDLSHKFYLRYSCSVASDLYIQSVLTDNSTQYSLIMKSNGEGIYSAIIEGTYIPPISDLGGYNIVYLSYGFFSLNRGDLTQDSVAITNPVFVDITANQSYFTSLGLSTDEEMRNYLDGIAYENFGQEATAPTVPSSGNYPENLCEGMTYASTVAPPLNASVPTCYKGSGSNLIMNGDTIIYEEDISSQITGDILGEQLAIENYKTALMASLYISLGENVRDSISQHKTYVRFDCNLKDGDYYLITGLGEGTTAEDRVTYVLAMKHKSNVISTMFNKTANTNTSDAYFDIQGYSRIIHPTTETSPTAVTDLLKSGETTLVLKNLVIVDIDANAYVFSQLGISGDTAIREYLDEMPYSMFGTAIPVESGIPITITNLTSGADVYYTTDRSTPTEASNKYMSRFSVEPPVTIKALSVRENLIDSDVSSLEITATDLCSAPVISFDAATKTVTITCETAGANIYYTTDGSTPSKSSTLYSAPFTTESSITVKAFAVADGYVNSILSTKKAFLLTWIAIDDMGTTSSVFWSVCYANGKFVAVGGVNAGTYSTDGINWTAVSDMEFGRVGIVYSVCYGNGKFVAVGNKSKGAYSTDGITWTAISDMKFDTYNIRSVCYGNGKFVAVGVGGKGAYSTDGITWTAIDDMKFGLITIYSVCYGNGKFVAVNATGNGAYSTDGVTWTAISDMNMGSYVINSVCYGNGKFVAVGVGGKGAYSTDGITWTAIDDMKFDSGNTIQSVCYGNGKFVAVGYGNKGSYSEDGINWIAMSDMKLSGEISINSVCYGNGKFVAVSYGNKGSYCIANEDFEPIENGGALIWEIHADHGNFVLPSKLLQNINVSSLEEYEGYDFHVKVEKDEQIVFDNTVEGYSYITVDEEAGECLYIGYETFSETNITVSIGMETNGTSGVTGADLRAVTILTGISPPATYTLTITKKSD